MDRRGFLSLCAVGTIAGCAVFESTNHQPAPEEASEITDTLDEQYRQRLTVEFELEAGSFTTAPLSPVETETVEVDVGVTAGVLDVWTTQETDYADYEAGGDVRPIEQLSESPVIGGTTLVGDLQPGDYRVVLDNTPAFGSTPEGVASGTATFERRLLSRNFFAFREDLESADLGYEQLGASEDRQWWLLRYVQGDDQSQRDASIEVQDITTRYADFVPAEGDRTDHSGLRILVEGPDAETLLEVSAPLARAYARGELDDQEYFREVQRTAR